MRKRLLAGGVAIACALFVAACGASPPPTQPNGGGGNGGGGGQPNPPANNLPAIDSFTVQGTRSPKEPANFADVGETVPIAAKVRDDDTPAEQLEYQWSATEGTFSGTGATVNWTAPASAVTPADVTITLKVVDHYGFPGQTPAFTQSVTGTTTLSLHDTVKEVGGMARQFLLDFSDSSITDVNHVMRNFDMTCSEAQDEAQQVANNRKELRIVKSSIGTPTVTIPFGNAFCPIEGGRTQRGDACSATPSRWESTVLSTGHYTVAEGRDWISAYYRSDSRAWKLCDSQFPGTCMDMTTGRACGAEAASAVAPDSLRMRIKGLTR